MKINYDPPKNGVSFDSMPSLVLQLSHTLQEIQKDLDYIKANLTAKEPDEYLTRKEMAKRFKVDISTIHNWVKKGLIKRHTIGGSVYFKLSEIELK
jgi:hypothetical protein